MTDGKILSCGDTASLAKDESWRFARFSRIGFDGFSTPKSVPAEIAEKYIEESCRRALGASGILVFVDDFPVYAKIEYSVLSQGVIFETQSDFAFSENVGLGMQAFAERHMKASRYGFYLHVPADLRLEEPFVVFRWQLAGATEMFPSSRVEIGNNALAKLCEFYCASPEATGTQTIARSEVRLGNAAEFSRDIVQAIDASSKIFRMEKVSAAENAIARGVDFCLGAGTARTTTELCADGNGALLDWRALNVAAGEQEIDWRTIQRHTAPGARSNLLCKNALLERSRTIFSGNILVDKIAQQTHAVQSCRNLVLSEFAEAHSLPGLEIDANDVHCSHGATTGTLDSEQLFYLMQRGLPDAEARMLLTLGFMDEVINACAGCAVADFVREKIGEKFGA